MRNRFFLLLLASVLSGSPALAAGNPSGFLGGYTLNGTTKVDVDAVGYHREFHPPLETVVTRGAADGELVFTITRLGHTCRLTAVAESDTAVTFSAGQKCPATIEESAFTADLTGTLRSGRASLNGKAVRLVADWDVEGTVKVWGMTIPGTPKGRMYNDASGTTP